MQSNKTARLLLWFNVALLFSPFAPLSLIYFERVSGSYALAGSIFTITLVASALFEVPTGVLSDRWGRQRVLIAGTAAAILGMTFYALGIGYWSLVIGAVLFAFATSLWSGNNDALLYESFDHAADADGFGHAVGSINAAVQLSMGASAILGGLLATRSFALAAWVTVGGLAVAFCIGLMIPNRKPVTSSASNPYLHLKEAVRLFISNRRLRLFSLFSILSGGLQESSYQFLPAFYLSVIPTSMLGVVNAFNKLIVYLSFKFGGAIEKRLGDARTLIADFWLDRTVSTVAFAVPSPASPWLVAFSGTLFGPYQIAQAKLLQEEFSDEHRATMGSLNSLGSSLFYGLMAIVLGMVADRLSPAKALLLFQVLIIPTFILLRMSLAHKKTA